MSVERSLMCLEQFGDRPLAHRVGRDTALHALNRYLRRPDAQPRQLAALVRDLGGGGC